MSSYNFSDVINVFLLAEMNPPPDYKNLATLWRVNLKMILILTCKRRNVFHLYLCKKFVAVDGYMDSGYIT